MENYKKQYNTFFVTDSEGGGRRPRDLKPVVVGSWNGTAVSKTTIRKDAGPIHGMNRVNMEVKS